MEALIVLALALVCRWYDERRRRRSDNVIRMDDWLAEGNQRPSRAWW